MKLERLFHVLVVLGGASISSSCATDGDRQARRDVRAADAASPATDGASGDAASGDAANSDGDAAAPLPQLCFCDGTEPCCDLSVEPPEEADGFRCCWATSCS